MECRALGDTRLLIGKRDNASLQIASVQRKKEKRLTTDNRVVMESMRHHGERVCKFYGEQREVQFYPVWRADPEEEADS